MFPPITIYTEQSLCAGFLANSWIELTLTFIFHNRMEYENVKEERNNKMYKKHNDY